MKIFISWSGDRSRAVAEALNDWLQRVIQAVEPFYTPVMEKGVKWSSEIDNALEGTIFGIVCLTPDNLKSTWIHYETGALSKTKDAVIWTFLHGLVPSDVPQPLGRFQHTLAEKNDVLKLLHSINRRLREVGSGALKDSLLEEIFEESWAKLEGRLKDAENLATDKSEIDKKPKKGREEKDVLNEILEAVRNQERKIDVFEAKLDYIYDFNTTAKNVLYKNSNNAEPTYFSGVKFDVIKSLNARDTKEIKKKIYDLEFEMKETGYITEIKEKESGYSVLLERANDFSLGLLHDLERNILSNLGSNVINWRPIPAKD